MHLTEKETASAALPAGLVREVREQLGRDPGIDLAPLEDALHSRFGGSLEAIVLYGSCLHNAAIRADEVVDFYVLVSDYRQAYEGAWLRRLNAWLPPNVFYLEADGGDSVLRAKYAVLSMADFEAGVGNWFHSYLWGRFAQPVRLIYARDERARQRCILAVTRAVMTFLRATLPVLGMQVVTARTIWRQGLQLSYSAELRPEGRERADQLARGGLTHYNRLTAAAAPALEAEVQAMAPDRYQCHYTPEQQRRALRRWRLRRWQGRVLSVLRLSKATVTFADCLDYAAWKVERHTGVCVEVTPRMRRHPLLWGIKALWRLSRRGVVR